MVLLQHLLARANLIMLTDMCLKTLYYNIYKITSYFAYTICKGNIWAIFRAQLPAVLKSP